jgi:hypothetical protein
MDTRIWIALQQAGDLPEAVQHKARTIGLLYAAARLIFVTLFVVILAAGIIGR